MKAVGVGGTLSSIRPKTTHSSGARWFWLVDRACRFFDEENMDALRAHAIPKWVPATHVELMFWTPRRGAR